jgi:hypothetical protein
MKPEVDITVQLRYWEGRLEGLDEGIKAVGAPEKGKDKAASESSVHLAVERATAGGWVDALRWVLKPGEERGREPKVARETKE